MVTIDDFAKLEFKVGTVIEAGEIEGSDKLLKLKVDFGILVDSAPVIASEESKNLFIASEESKNLFIASEESKNLFISSESEKSQDKVQESEGGEVSEGSNELRDSSATPQKDSTETNQTADIRQILSGIKQWYTPEDLIGKQFIFITNLAPRKMMGLESQGMIMAAQGEEKPIPLIPSEKVPNGAKIR